LNVLDKDLINILFRLRTAYAIYVTPLPKNIQRLHTKQHNMTVPITK